MEGSGCVAALQAAPAHDVPRPLRPGAKHGSTGEARGAGCWWKSFLHGPAAVVGWPGGHRGGREGWRGLWSRGRGHVLFLPSQMGIYCCLGVREGRCQVISGSDEML